MCLSSLPSTVSSLIFTALQEAAVTKNDNYFIFTQQVSSTSKKLSCHRKTHVSLSIFPPDHIEQYKCRQTPYRGANYDRRMFFSSFSFYLQQLSLLLCPFSSSKSSHSLLITIIILVITICLSFSL